MYEHRNMEVWASRIVERNTFKSVQDIRAWWNSRGRELYGNTAANKAMDAITEALADNIEQKRVRAEFDLTDTLNRWYSETMGWQKGDKLASAGK
jgi:hypothetical protein